MDFREIADSAVGFYVRILRQTEDHQDAIESFDERVSEHIEDLGVDPDEGWVNDMDLKQLGSFLEALLDNAMLADENLDIGPLSTHLDSIVGDRVDELMEENPSVVEAWKHAMLYGFGTAK